MERTTMRKSLSGIVISKSGNKSIVVKIETKRKHPIYKKASKYSKNYHVHDEENKAKVGDKVVIMQTRPISKQKNFRLVSIKEVK